MPATLTPRPSAPVLSRTHRLTRGDDISEISRRGARARAGDLVVSARRTEGESVRGCVVVGKRAGGAVARNRQRRRLQHALADLLPALPRGTDLVIRGGADVASLSAPALTAALDDTVRRAVQRATAAR